MCPLLGVNIYCVRSWADVEAIATSLGTAAAVVALAFGALQLAQQSRTSKDTFENLFVQEYHKLVQRIPTKAFFGETLDPTERRSTLGEFYHYIDLCNTQAYHSKTGRITRTTWREWREGILCNLARPEFRRAWSFIADCSNKSEFEDLRALAPPAPYEPSEPYI